MRMNGLLENLPSHEKTGHRHPSPHRICGDSGSVESQQNMAEIDRAPSRDAKAGFDDVVSAISAAHHTAGEKHGEVLGGACRRDPQSMRHFAHRQGLTLGQLAEDTPTALAGDGGEDPGDLKSRSRCIGGCLCWICHGQDEVVASERHHGCPTDRNLASTGRANDPARGVIHRAQGVVHPA